MKLYYAVCAFMAPLFLNRSHSRSVERIQRERYQSDFQNLGKRAGHPAPARAGLIAAFASPVLQQIAELHAAVRAINEAEDAWYQDPSSTELRDRFKALVLRDSPKDRRVSGVIGIALKNSSRLSTRGLVHHVMIVHARLPKEPGQDATVETVETTRFDWITGGGILTQDRNPHTYTLRRVGDAWKVIDDRFDFQQ
jgi:hypothetical protein